MATPQTGDFLKAAGAHASTAAAAAAAAQSAKPKNGQYQSEFNEFYQNMSAEERKLMPDPARVACAAADEAAPMKVPVSGAPTDSPKKAKSKAALAAPPPAAEGAAWPQVGAPQMPMPPYMGGFGMPPNPFMAQAMAAYPPFPDPSMAAAMGGFGSGVPFMPMPMIGGPPMYPMYPMAGMPMGMLGAAHAAGSGNKGEDAGVNKDKTRERRKRSKKGKGTTEEDPETDEVDANRSEELNEVRRTQGKCGLTLRQVMPHIIEFATDQHGSRFLQAKIEESADQAKKQEVFDAILPQVTVMSKDQFGNFVVQKMFDIGNANQKRSLADRFQGEVLALSKEQHGCRVIQKALQLLPRDAQTKLAAELHDHVGECIENMHGNHVIQKCIEQMPPDSVNFIIDTVNERVEFMSEHMYGCRVIQRLLEHCAPHQLQVMLAKIETCTAKLAQKSYGNYVVQHMLEHGRTENKKNILGIVTANILDFAKSKCSSNVVEKCFEIATIGEHADALVVERQKLFAAVLEPRPGEVSTPLQQLMEDRFGNYIVQRMLEHSRGEERDKLKNQLLQNTAVLTSNPNAKHILSALQKEYGIILATPGEA